MKKTQQLWDLEVVFRIRRTNETAGGDAPWTKVHEYKAQGYTFEYDEILAKLAEHREGEDFWV